MQHRPSKVFSHISVADPEGVPEFPWNPLWLDLVLRSTDDRLDETLLPGWGTKKTASVHVAHLSMP